MKPECDAKFDCLNSRLRNAATLVVVLCATVFSTLPGLSQTKTVPESQAVPGIAKSGLPVSAPARGNPLGQRPQISAAQGAASLHVSTPFERVLQPLVNRRTTLGDKSLSATKGRLGRAADVSGPLSLNFPGFFTAPFVSASPVTDATPLFVSVTGDFNHDGKPDIATINEDGTVNVLLNGGGSNLIANGVSYSDTSAVASSPDIAYAVAADMNGDGYSDIVGLDAGNSALVLWINNGSGGFRPSVSVPVLPSNGASFVEGGDIAVGDVNGDGTLDVVAVSEIQVVNKDDLTYHTNIVTQVFAGDGLGNLEPPTEVDSTLAGQVYAGIGPGMKLADMNGDGTLDIVINLQTNPLPILNFVEVALNTAGTFAPFRYSVNESHVNHFNFLTPDVEVADVNGDGFPDVLWITGGYPFNAISVAFGDGTGALSQQAEQGDTAAAYNIPTLGLFHLADVNGDGKPDIVSYNNGSVAILPGNGDGTFSTYPSNVYTASDGVGDVQPTVLDYNGDGRPDIIYVDSELSLASFYAGNGDGSFQGAHSVSPGTVNPGNLQVAGSGDLNGDGIPDLVAFDYTPIRAGQNSVPDIVSLLSDGKGGFRQVLGVPALTLSSLGFATIRTIELFPTVVDLNGDGRADIVLSNKTGVYTALSNADGSFQTPVPIQGLTLQCLPNLSDAGNIDGSGHTSLVMAYPGDASCGGTGSVPPGVVVLLNDGKANFTASVEAVGSQPFQAKLADLDGDGYPDLLLSDNDSSAGVAALYTLPNQATAGAPGNYFDAARRSILLSGYVIGDILTGDYNGDGIADLALATAGEVDGDDLIPQTAGILLLPGQGGFNFGTPNLVGQGTIPSWAEWADINQDGIPDLVIASAEAEGNAAPVFGMSVLPGLGKGLFASPVSQVFPNADTYVFTGDFNHDGAPDVAVSGANSSGPYAGLYLNRGADGLALSVSSASVSQGSPITLTASLKTSFTDVSPAGTVTFTSNGTVLGTSSLSNGVASLTYNIAATSATGAYPIAAAYAGDGHFNQATATGSYSVTALPPAISASASSTSINLASGQSTVVTLTLAANATYDGTVAISSTSTGSGITVAVNPSTVTLNGGQDQQVSVVIGTGPVTTAAAGVASRPGCAGSRFLTGVLTGTLTLAALFPLFLRRSRRPRNGWILALLLCAGLGCFAGTTGCSGGPSAPAPAAVTQTVVVTVKPSVSGVAAQTVTFNVNLQ